MAENVPYVFLSYARADRERCQAVADALGSAGVRVWIDREAISGGASWGGEIVEGIKDCAALLICCTEAALQSRNVRQEIQLAWRYERPYVPLLLERVEFPEQVQYFLEGWQWVELLERASEAWLPELLKALARHDAVAPALPSSAARLATTAAPAAVSAASSRPAVLPAPTAAPFVGRAIELERLRARVAEAADGHGGLVLLAGEPGIGKSRLALEADAIARDGGCGVAWGRCYESGWLPPYAPWVEALSEVARDREPAQIRQLLGQSAATVARLVPAIGAALPDLPPPPALSPDEERFRVHDAVTQFLLRVAAAQPLLLILDDLHWADQDSVGLLSHLVRFTGRSQLLVLGLYRDVDLDRQHPLATALPVLRREERCERLLLSGLSEPEVAQLLAQQAGHETEPAFLEALYRETEGNPLFLQETLRHLVESGRLVRQDGRWTSPRGTVAELGIPEGVKEVIGRRLSRLSAEANRVFTLASAFPSGFEFSVLQSLSGLADEALLDVLDEGLGVQLVRPLAGRGEMYEFTHALVRRTLNDELSPSRTVRLHRRIAETLVLLGQRRPEEVAFHYHASAALPGAEAGLPYCEAATSRAEAAAAWGQAAIYLGWILELLPDDDERRGRLGMRYALASLWALQHEEGERQAIEAARLIAASEGNGAAAAELAQVASTAVRAGSMVSAWRLAAAGLPYAEERRDAAWAMLRSLDLSRREAEDPQFPGIVVASPEREEVWAVTDGLAKQFGEQLELFRRPWQSRAAFLEAFAEAPTPVDAQYWGEGLVFTAGEFRRARPLVAAAASESESRGQINWAAAACTEMARCHVALGDFTAGAVFYRRGRALAARLPAVALARLLVITAETELGIALYTRWEERYAGAAALISEGAVEHAWTGAPIRAVFAQAAAKTGHISEALGAVESLLPAVEHAIPGSNYTLLVCDAVAALWNIERTDFAAVLERNLIKKVIDPDFRYPMRDGRLSMARLCALQGRLGEARHWFSESRAVLEEQGCRPLRAICDYDEALALRRSGAGSSDRAEVSSLLTAALAQFRELGMPGWIEQAETLSTRIGLSTGTAL